MLRKLALLISLTLGCFSQVQAQLICDKKLPLEFSLLCESINIDDLMPKELERLRQSAELINRYSSAIGAEEFMMIVKSEIYKSVLEMFPPGRAEIINTIQINSLKEKFHLATQLKPFPHWVFKSILDDIETHAKKTNEKTLLITSNDPSVSALQQRNRVLQPWVDFFLKHDAPEINLLLRALALKATENCALVVEVLARHAYGPQLTEIKKSELIQVSQPKNIPKDEIKAESQARKEEAQEAVIQIPADIPLQNEAQGSVKSEQWAPQDDVPSDLKTTP